MLSPDTVYLRILYTPPPRLGFKTYADIALFADSIFNDFPLSYHPPLLSYPPPFFVYEPEQTIFKTSYMSSYIFGSSVSVREAEALDPVEVSSLQILNRYAKSPA